MIKIAVCDDEELFAKHIGLLLKEYDFRGEEILIDTYTSGEELFREAPEKEYNILIMDIELSEEEPEYVYDNGMTLSRRIKDMFPDTIVIFFTGKPGHEKSLLQYESFRYMTKPIQPEILYMALEAAVQRVNGGKEKNTYYIRKSGITIGLDINKILYMVSDKRIISIVCQNETIDFYGKLDIVEKEISQETDDFVRAGKSYLIHMRHVKMYSAKSITMTNGEVILIPKNYRKNVMDKMEEFTRAK